jgi:meso-butanediol dehydrogenase/(S,S)-butanediol dehydrogenase/diacetyl reductase
MGGTAIGVAADVVSRAAVKSILDAAQNAFGALHGIINNAGIAQTKPFLDITEDDWLRIKQVNSLDVMIGKQEAAPRLIGQGNGGEIVNTASIACKQGFEPLAHYSASKFSVVGFTRLAQKRLGVTESTSIASVRVSWLQRCRKRSAAATRKPA